ncbi:helix-turn-helix transcriptional regulator [Galactobacter caseinivorans]|uniref:YafY family transcriptional regulator n=1 Tax=Galactobacter caseinivorans TaxID=2676123 RepID=A0A496PK62_9MICC|nr:YafY family protein [Galactobacter caseinivorans]RKW70848.1 YafY family transcriptional regulator [Galactobacter caseinivorans]
MTDPTSRALQLLGLMQARAVWSGPELAQKLGVSTRTVRRDVERLRSLGYTVESDAGAEGGYSLGRGQVLPPLLLDEREATAVTLALSMAARGQRGVDPEAALSALGKIDAVMPGALRFRVNGLRAAMDLGEADAPSADAGALLVCADAIRRTVRLRFDYRDRHGEESAREVEPHRLTSTAGGWRLTAFDLHRNDWRTFRLDRLDQAAPTTWQFRPRPGLQEALERAKRPAPPAAWRHQIRVRIHAPLAAVEQELGRRAGQLSPGWGEETELLSGATDAVESAWWLARIPFQYTVLGDDAVLAATRELADRVGRAGRGESADLPDAPRW